MPRRAPNSSKAAAQAKSLALQERTRVAAELDTLAHAASLKALRKAGELIDTADTAAGLKNAVEVVRLARREARQALGLPAENDAEPGASALDGDALIIRRLNPFGELEERSNVRSDPRPDGLAADEEAAPG